MSMHVAHILNFSMVFVLISTKRTQAKGADCFVPACRWHQLVLKLMGRQLIGVIFHVT